MSTKNGSVKRVIILIFLFSLSVISRSQVKNTPEPDSLQLSTLSSIEKLNDNLYLMHYHADYHFDSFMEVGTGDLSYEEFTEEYLGKIPSDLPWACSAFMVKNSRNILAGRNFDWENIPGMILFTSPDSGYSSVSLVPIDLMLDKEGSEGGDNRKLLWTPYYPVEGMNERGLVVAELAVEGENAYDQNKVSMFSLQLIRLLLDYSADLDEAIGMLGKYNNSTSERMHFFIADSAGSSAVVEYIDNKLVINRNKDDWQVVTNIMIAGNAERKLRKECGRYNYLSQYLEAHHRAILEQGAFNMLRAVSVDRVISSQFKISTSTQWSVIYDLQEKSLSLVSRRNFAKTYSYSLSE